MWWHKAESQPESAFVRSALGQSSIGRLFGLLVFGVFGFVGMQGSFADLYLRFRNPQPVDPIAVVTIGPEALRLWTAGAEAPITPRDLLATLVDYAAASGARGVVLDIVLETPSGADDALARAAEALPVVAAAGWTRTGRDREFVPAPSAPLHELALGVANLREERPLLGADTRIVRAAPLGRQLAVARCSTAWPKVVEAETCTGEDCPTGGDCGSRIETLAALGVHAAWMAVETAPLQARLDQCDGADCSLPELGLETLDEDRWINFRGDASDAVFTQVTAAEILHLDRQRRLLEHLGAGSDPDERLRDRVVVIGRLDPSDLFATPHSFPDYRDAEMAGVFVHAHLAATLLDKRLRFAPRPLMWVLGLLAVGAVTWTHRRLRPAMQVVLWTLVCVALTGLGQTVFEATDGYVLEFGPVVLGVIVGAILNNFWEGMRSSVNRGR